jgi:hypothetical protein
MNLIKWLYRLATNKSLDNWRKVQILLGIGNGRFSIPQSGQGQYIYALVDPATLKPFYVGRSNNPGRRYVEHVNEIDGTNKAQRVNSIKRRFHLPYMIILEQCNEGDVKMREAHYIQKLGGVGRLTNMKRV